ncbi:MAG TPA: hypothetical protein VG838_18320 [Opitutaceae bacterium]|nr:hypothetical protein [Lacunisphaera sp.]HWA11401.1 hypothetical protein [Opitutaceae bacterium]
MKLIWHVVKKDLRRARWLLPAWLAVIGLQVALGAWARTGSDWFFQVRDGVRVVNGILIWLQLLTVMFFAAEIVQEDSLVEPNAHWLVLPLSGRRLLAAKLAGLAIIVWLLPLVLLWPWWLSNHWGTRDLALGTLILIGLHTLIALPALMVASLTDSWTRFLTWMAIFTLAVVVAGMSLAAFYEAIPFEVRPPETLPLSRAAVGIAIIVGLGGIVLANQYLTRRRRGSLAVVGVAALAAMLALAVWPSDFMAAALAAVTPALPPSRPLRLDFSLSGGTKPPTGKGTFLQPVGLDVAGSIGGLEPGEAIYGQLLNYEWKWGNAIERRSAPKQGVLVAFFSGRPETNVPGPARSPDLFPRRDTLYSLGMPPVPSYVVSRLLREPAEFRATAEMAVIHPEILAEVAPRAGVRFGRGAERYAIVAVMPAETDLNLVMVHTLPISDTIDLQRFPFVSYRSFVFFNRSDREIIKTLGRTSTIGKTSNDDFGSFAGVQVTRITYRAYSPKEYFPDRPRNERYGPVDPLWFNDVALIWTENRAVARFETEIVEPHFVTREETPARTPSGRKN